MVNVEWTSAAYSDFTEICLHASSREERDSIQQATHEIDRLLQISSTTAGEKVFAGQLEPATMILLWSRQGSIPEISRRVRLGPIEVYYTDHEDEGRAIVWCLRLRI